MNYIWEEIWQNDPYNKPHEREARAHRRLAAIRPHLLPNADLGNVLELGCGDGSFAAGLAKSVTLRLASYKGIDLSPTALKRARTTVRDPRFHFDCADLTSVEFATGTTDTVFMLGVLEHLPDASRLLARVHRALRPTGRLILTTSNKLSLMYVQRRLREAFKVWPYGYQRNYTPSEFRDLLSEHFVELALAQMHGDWDFPLVALLDRAMARIDERFGRYVLAVVERGQH